MFLILRLQKYKKEAECPWFNANKCGMRSTINVVFLIRIVQFSRCAFRFTADELYICSRVNVKQNEYEIQFR